MLSVIDIGIQRAAQTSDRLSQLFGTVQLADGSSSLRCVGTTVASLLELSGRYNSPESIPRPSSSNQEQCVPLGFPKTMDRAMKGGIPVGTVTEITGPSGVGKTRLVHHIAAANAVVPQHDDDDNIEKSGTTSSRVLIVDSDGGSMGQASSLLSVVQFMALDRADEGDHDARTSKAMNAIHIMNLRDAVSPKASPLLPTVQRQSMAAFIKALYRHVSSNPRCKLIMIDSFTTLLDNIEFPKVVTPPPPQWGPSSSSWNAANDNSSKDLATSSSRLLDTQTLLQELKQLSEIFRCAVIITTHASPYSSGPEINRHSGGLTMFHAVNTRIVLQWQSSGVMSVPGQPTTLPSINTLKGFAQPSSSSGPSRVFTVIKSPICPTPLHFSIHTQDQGRGNVHDPTLVATTAPLRTT